jgi:hypothetical protein
MKAILEFNLPEEDEEFRNSANGTRFLTLLLQIDRLCRNELKYETGKHRDDVLGEIREIIAEADYPF